MSTHPAPDTPRVDPHVWGRSTGTPITGAVIHAGRRDVFLPAKDIPAIIDRLEAIYALSK